MKKHLSTAILEQFSTFFRSSVLTFNRIINAIVLLLFGLLRCIERVHPPKLVDASSKLEYTGEFPLTWYVGTVRGSRVPLLNLIMGLSYGPSTISMNTSFLSMVQNRRSMLSSLNEKRASQSFYARGNSFQLPQLRVLSSTCTCPSQLRSTLCGEKLCFAHERE